MKILLFIYSKKIAEIFIKINFSQIHFSNGSIITAAANTVLYYKWIARNVISFRSWLEIPVFKNFLGLVKYKNKPFFYLEIQIKNTEICTHIRICNSNVTTQ